MSDFNITNPLANIDTEEQSIQSYYDSIAADYDRSRFANTYGRYIDDQERKILKRWLPRSSDSSVLDLACGTGRFLDLATAGLDASANMLEIASQKYPDVSLIQASACEIPLPSASYDAIFSLHFFMHLNPAKVATILDECHRILRPGGMLIFDIPSALRRNLVRYRAEDWHGATALSIPQIREATQGKWELQASSGVMLFPVHRIPTTYRDRVRSLDDFLCQTWLKNIASYLFIQLIKYD
ncbi:MULTISPECIES: class I SAM-dependent methyltransferase [unclassified Leptolyngbya]|uniref:class I SAM-dependent methyltransferase n=1 Tax=unclassified Leptolyngbya TaxID=2650499 RepID=UPI001689B185|nr:MULTISPECIES: class I SAM-dependent methyltransferase [unclassified Leptolyngbya]MBD1912946.1 class I SAM-dependent methyltransferase [Leptolyngbya sp. FACHB-8]MBD2154725.1 class I SAM-dependent methyltransferase [Leptolyngbya sp. FACHB-16]